MKEITSISDLYKKIAEDVKYQRLVMIGYQESSTYKYKTFNITYKLAIDWMEFWLKENVRQNQVKKNPARIELNCLPMVQYLNSKIYKIDRYVGDSTQHLKLISQ